MNLSNSDVGLEVQGNHLLRQMATDYTQDGHLSASYFVFAGSAEGGADDAGLGPDFVAISLIEALFCNASQR